MMHLWKTEAGLMCLGFAFAASDIVIISVAFFMHFPVALGYVNEVIEIVILVIVHGI